MEYGAFSLLPSLVAIVLAIVTRRILLSLFVAIWVGAGLLAFAGETAAPATTSSPAAAVGMLQAGGGFLWRSFWDADHGKVLLFSLLFGAMVGSLEASGALRDVVGWVGRFIRGRRSGQSLIAVLGLGIFFDDYANTLLLGGTMRSSCDTFRISRAKLAYLVDSTAAPVAGLALISTWVVTEMTLIGEGLALAEPPVEATAFQVFLSSLPYRFYPILAIALVAIVAITGRDFGPMRTAEQAAWDGEGSDGEGSDGEGTDGEGTDGEATAGSPSLGRSWLAACLPIFACLGSVIAVLIVTGRGALGGAAATDSGIAYWGEVIGNSDSYLAMIVGGAVGSLVALATGGWAQQGSRLPALLAGAVRGAGQILPAMVVLWLAWALSEMTGDTYLDTGGYLAGWLQEGFPGWCLPTVVFLVAAGVAFSTGTSWGTMGLLTPIAVQLGLQASGNDPGHAIFLTTAGSVLAGAIFGDHCSPLSDTTVLSSRASGCQQVEHVRTQIPYALLAGGIAILCGTIPAAWGLASGWCILLGIGGLLLAVRLVGKRPLAVAMPEGAATAGEPERGER